MHKNDFHVLNYFSIRLFFAKVSYNCLLIGFCFWDQKYESEWTTFRKFQLTFENETDRKNGGFQITFNKIGAIGKFICWFMTFEWVRTITKQKSSDKWNLLKFPQMLNTLNFHVNTKHATITRKNNNKK